MYPINYRVYTDSLRSTEQTFSNGHEENTFLPSLQISLKLSHQNTYVSIFPSGKEFASSSEILFSNSSFFSLSSFVLCLRNSMSFSFWLTLRSTELNKSLIDCSTNSNVAKMGLFDGAAEALVLVSITKAKVNNVVEKVKINLLFH